MTTAEDFLNDRKPTAEDFLGTPTGLPSINKSTGPQPDLGEQMLNAIPGGPLINATFKGAKTIAGNIIKGTPDKLENLSSPENIIPTAAMIAAGSNPITAPLAVPIGAGAGMAYDIAKNSRPPTFTEKIEQLAMNSVLPGGGLAGQLASLPEDQRKDAITSGVINLAIGLPAEALSGLISKGAKGGFLKDTVLPSGKDAVPSSLGASESGIPLDATQRTDSSFGNTLRKVANRGVAGKGIMMSADRKATEAIQKATKVLAQDIAGTVSTSIPRDVIAQTFKEPIHIGRIAQDAIEDIKYSNVDKALGGTIRDIPDFETVTINDPVMGTKQIQQQVGSHKELVGGLTIPTNEIKSLVGNEKIISQLSGNIDPDHLGRILNKVSKLSDGENFLTMKRLRSDLLDVQRDSSSSSAKKTIGDIVEKINSAMDATITHANPEAKAALEDAHSFYRTGKKTFENDFTANLLINDSKLPDDIGKQIYDTGRTDPIKILKKAADRAEELTKDPKYATILAENPRFAGLENKNISSKKIMDTARSGWFERLLEKNSTIDNTIPGENKAVVNYSGVQADLQNNKNTREMAKELLTPEQNIRLNKLANVAALAEKRGASNTVRESLTLAGMVAQLGPSAMVAKLITTPEGINYLTKGVEDLSLGTKTAIKSGTMHVLRAGYLLLTGNEEGQ